MDINDLFKGLVPTPAVNAALAKQIVQVPLTMPLHDFQQEAVDHVLRDSVNHPYAYLGLEMGLGKTPCAIAIAKAASSAGVGPTCFVVPPSMRTTFGRECHKFAPEMKAVVLRGQPLPDEKLPEADIYIIGDSALAKPKYKPPHKKYGKPDPRECLSAWALLLSDKIVNIIIDEAHRFKNESNRSRALRALSDPVPGIRVLMSGTPTPNGRHQELANQINILGSKAWKDIGGEGMFWHHYAPQVDQYGGRDTNDAEGLFQAMSSTWYYRRLRDDVVDLPNKGRTPLSIDAPIHGTTGLKGTVAKATRDYRRVEKDLIAFLREEGALKGDGLGQKRAEALIKLTKLRKLAGMCKVLGIVQHIREILDETPGGVFVVAEHKDVMEELEAALLRFNPTTVQGGMTDREKQENIDAFVAGESRVMIGQITAAGVGLTLHGGGINHRVIIAQLPWTPADLKQAEDRLHRLGQTKEVHVEVCLAAIDGLRTVDERLWALLEKKNFASTTITDGVGENLLREVQDGLLDSYR